MNDNLLLPAGSRIAVVVLESVPVEDGTRYALINTGSLNEAGAEAYNALCQNEGKKVKRYARGIVNPGESFVSFTSGAWTDWYDAVASFQNRGNNTYVAYDNLPIKAYVYPWSQVEKIHDLSNRVPAPGGEAAVCPEDGYTLLDVAG